MSWPGDAKMQMQLLLLVMLTEYMVLGMVRAILPPMQEAAFGVSTITIASVCESAKGFFAFAANPVLGRLSDQPAWGRKKLLLLTTVGTMLPPCILAFSSNMYLYQLAVSISGAFSATWAIAFAFISDIEPRRDKRLQAFSLLMSTLAISLVVAPGLGASLCNGDDCTALFRTLPVLVLANAALIVYGLVEPKRQQADGAETAGTSIAGTVTGLGGAATGEEPTPYHSIYASFAMLQADPSVLGNLGMLTACYYMPVYGCIATLLLYLRTHFAFEPHMGATLLAAIGMSATASCSVGVRIMSNTLKLAPTTIIKIGLSSLFLAQVGMGVGSMLGQFYFAALLFGVGFTVMPSVNALVAERASPQQQGTAQGAMHGIKALTEGVGPLVYAILFRIFDGMTFIPDGSAYIVGAGFIIAALRITARLPTSAAGAETVQLAATEP